MRFPKLMKAYFGGQIKEEQRGDLALVITREKEDQGPGETYGVFLYSPFDEEFLQLTGVRAVRTPPERVYIGVNQPVGNGIAMQLNGTPVREDLRTIDNLLVYPYFLKEQSS